MARQSTVTQFQKAGARGMVANAEARNIISRSLKAGPCYFADPVYRDASAGGDEVCSIVAADGDFMGVARRAGTLNPANTPKDAYATGDEVPIVMDGVVWVETADAVVAGANANFNIVTRLWTDAAVAGNVIAVPNVEFDSTNAAAGLAKIRVKRVV